MADTRATLVIAFQDLASRGLAALAGKFDKLRADIEASRGIFAGIAGAVGLVGTAALKASGQFEQWQVAFSAMLGSTERANELLGQLRDFASRTPFELPEVVEGAKRLMAFGTAAQDIIPTMRALGDVAAGLGVPVDRLVNAFGQVRAAGRLMGQEVLQFTNAGVPILDMLAQRFGKTTGEVKKLVEAGLVGFEDVRAVLFAATEQGGRFHNLMENQSRTLFGRINELKDSFFKLALTIGNVLLPHAIEFLNRTIDAANAASRFAEENRALTVAVVALASAVGLAAGALAALGFALPALVTGLTAISGLLGTLGLSFAGLTAAAVTTNEMLGVTAVAAGGLNLSLLALVGTAGILTAGVGALALGYARLRSAMDEASEATDRQLRGQRGVKDAMQRGFEVAQKYSEATVAQMRANRDAAATYAELTEGIRGLVIAMEQAEDPEADKRIQERIDKLKALRDALNAQGPDQKPQVDTTEAELEALQAKADREIEILLLADQQLEEMERNRLAAKLAALGEEERMNELMRARDVAAARAANAQKWANAKATLNLIAATTQTKSKEFNAVVKAARLTQALLDGYAAVQTARATPFPLNIILPPIVAAQAAATVAQISAVPLAEGGVALPVPGGTLARVAEAGGKEAVLPLEDARSMEAIREALGGTGGTNVFNIGTLIADDLSLDEFARRLDEKLFRLKKNRESAQ